jgi:hypothetical protein
VLHPSPPLRGNTRVTGRHSAHLPKTGSISGSQEFYFSTCGLRWCFGMAAKSLCSLRDIILACTLQLSCDPSHRCHQSSTQRCSTYTLHTVHDREPQQCSVETGNEGNVVCVHWLGAGSYPSQYLFHTSYFSQTLHVEFCIMYNPKSEPPTEQWPTNRT